MNPAFAYARCKVSAHSEYQFICDSVKRAQLIIFLMTVFIHSTFKPNRTGWEIHWRGWGDILRAMHKLWYPFFGRGGLDPKLPHDTHDTFGPLPPSMCQYVTSKLLRLLNYWTQKMAKKGQNCIKRLFFPRIAKKSIAKALSHQPSVKAGARSWPT